MQLRMKLHRPHLKSSVVERPRLVEKLVAGEGGARLFIVSGSAGYGKTTIVSQWLTDKERVAWVNLDESDNDLVRFWAYVISGLQAVDASIGKGALAELRSAALSFKQAADDDAPSFLCTLLNDLDKLTDNLYIVLDDFQVIQSEAILKSMAFFLGYLPLHIKLVLITRQEPRLPIGRLRVRGEIVELNQWELAFQLSETQAFLQAATGQSVGMDAVCSLHKKAEGWIASLQLAALSINSGAETLATVDIASTEWKRLQEYFLEEVFNKQEEDVQRFLLSTSILKVLHAPLCESLTAHQDCYGILTKLEQEGFIHAVDAEHSWFRYQGLFQQLLRDYLMRHCSATLTSLHRSASEWLIANECIDEALSHAFKAGDSKMVAQHLETKAEEMWNRGELTTLQAWISKLPTTEVKQRPNLALFHALHLLFEGELQEVDVLLDYLDQITTGYRKGRIYAIRAFSAHFRGDVHSLIKWTKMASHLIKPNEPSWYLGVAMLGADCRVIQGDVDGAEREYLRALAISKQEQQFFLALVLGMKLTNLYVNRGQLSRGNALCDEMLVFGEEHGFANSERVMPFWIIKGNICCERNQLTEAQKHYDMTMSLSLKMGNSFVSKWCRLSQIRLMFAQDNLDQAESVLGELEANISIHDTFLPSMIVSFRVELALRKAIVGHTEQLTQAKLMLVDRSVHELKSFTFYRELEFITYARLLIAEQDWEEALVFLNELEGIVQMMGLTNRLVEVLLLASIAHYNIGAKDKVGQTMGRLLRIAAEEGYLRIFLDEGASAAQVLQLAKELGIYVEYISQIEEHFPSEIPVASSLTEQLGERELEVLSLMEKGLTNQEIAGQLYISLSTVKWHASNIYGKLMVNNRVQAIDKARKIGLIR